MTDTKPSNGITESVYLAHKKRVNASQRYEPEQDVQGYYINKMKTIAFEKIEGKDEARMRCGTFKEIDMTCRAIGKILKIKRHQVYSPLNIVGRDKIYNKFKIGGSDVFADIAELRDKSIELSYASMGAMDEIKRFVPTTMESTVKRVTRSTKRRAQDVADGAGVRTSELNLYYTMHGIKILIDVEPPFMYLADNEIVEMIMGVLRESERNIQTYCNTLRSNTNVSQS